MTATDRRVELVDQIQKGMGVSRTRARVIADALLESEWLAARDRRVAAQTLRDAKAAIHAKDGNPPWYFLKGRAFVYVEDLYRTLDALRADTTEGTHHD